MGVVCILLCATTAYHHRQPQCMHVLSCLCTCMHCRPKRCKYGFVFVSVRPFPMHACMVRHLHTFVSCGVALSACMHADVRAALVFCSGLPGERLQATHCVAGTRSNGDDRQPLQGGTTPKTKHCSVIVRIAIVFVHRWPQLVAPLCSWCVCVVMFLCVVCGWYLMQ